MKPLPGRCPDCWQVVDVPADICCPRCHARRREQLSALQAQGAGDQSCTPDMEDKMYAATVGGRACNEETRRMHSGARNGRVMRKGEIYGG